MLWYLVTKVQNIAILKYDDKYIIQKQKFYIN